MKIRSTATLTLAMLASFAMAPAFAADFFVKPTFTSQAAVDSDPDGVGLTFNVNAFALISGTGSALAASANGDTIYVLPGSYGVPILMNSGASAKNVNIYGPNRGVNPITGTRGPEATFRGIVFSGRSNITIDGLTFDGEFISGGNNRVTGGGNNTSNVTFQNNIVRNTDATAVTMSGNNVQNFIFRNNLVENVILLNSGGGGNSGLNMTGSQQLNALVAFNSFRNIQYAGIQIAGTGALAQDGTRIIGNSIQNTGRHGINVGPRTTNLVIAGNYIANVNTQDNRSDLFTGGVRLYSGSDGVDTVTIVGNTIINANHGVFLRPFLTGSPAVEQPTMLANNINISNNNITNSVNGGITNGAFDVTGTYSGTNNYFAGNVGGDFISLDPDSDPNNTSAPAPSALLLDRDGDGLSDAAEVYIYGTDPDLFDTDGDGVSDGIEVALGTNPLDKASFPGVAQIPGTGDTDGDGYRDDFEVLVGTDPSKASSRPRLGDVNGNGVIDNGDAAILFQVISGNLPPFAFDTTRFDVNQDGIVNNQDANILFNRFLGVPGFELLPYRP